MTGTKRTTLLLVALAPLAQAGCFLRMPEREVPSATAHVGHQGKLEVPLRLARALESTPIAFAPGDELGENQSVIEQLEAGTTVDVKGVVSRATPWGHGVFYVCRVMPNGTKFDLPIRHANLIGISDPELAKRASQFDPRQVER